MNTLKMNAENSDKEVFPLVSIGVLTYQHEKYIEDCLQGILAQTYPCIELIVLDDASTDGTADIVSSFRGKFEKKGIKFHFIRHDVNTGNVPANVNKMIHFSSGQYTMMQSGDDILLDCAIDSLVEVFETTDCSVAHANAYIIDDNYKYGERFSKKVLLRNYYQIHKEDLFEKLLISNCIVAPAAMVPKWIYDKYGLYDENIGYEDYDFWLRLAAEKEPFVYLNQGICLYRKSETGLSNCNTKSKFVFMYNHTIKTLKKHLKKLPLDKRKKIIVYTYREWIGRARENEYLGIYFLLNLKLIQWALRNKLKKIFRDVI